MGYDLYVSRGQDRVDLEIDEWLDTVHATTDLRLVGFVEARSPSGETIRYESGPRRMARPPGWTSGPV
jgi:hypothetical protein